MKRPFLRSFRLRNFKAVRDSKAVRLTPLTVFIGNNGSGKSSLIEGMMTYQMIVRDGLEPAMNYWRGFEYIRNNAVDHPPISVKVDRPYEKNPLEFLINCQAYQSAMAVTTDPNGEIFIHQEALKIGKKAFFQRNSIGDISLEEGDSEPRHLSKCQDDESIIASPYARNEYPRFNIDPLEDTLRWQFVNLNPYSMGLPLPQKRTSRQVQLNSDGSNLSQYLLDIYRLDPVAFNGIVETMQYVLPYARDLQTTLTSREELEPKVYLQLIEGDFKLPGWLFSTGTLRILALLALLRHPDPPPLILIEEIENGLDPQTIHLIVEEIRNAVESGNAQIILTSHSPYLLDLLELEHIVLVERDESGQPVFSRPADQDSLQEWSKRFGPGRLYTENRLGKGRS